MALSEVEQPGVNLVDPTELVGGQRVAVEAEQLDLLAQRDEPQGALVHDEGLGAPGRLLLDRLASYRTDELEVVGVTGRGELLDREILVVADRHPQLHAREELLSRACARRIARRDVVAIAVERLVVD